MAALEASRERDVNTIEWHAKQLLVQGVASARMGTTVSSAS